MSYLAQINIAKMNTAIDSPVMADFVHNLDRINALAEKSEGFIWRLKDDESNATIIQVFEDEFIVVNMSVWKTINALFEFTYVSDYLEIFKREKEWFHKIKEMHMAFCFVEEGNLPTPHQTKERLTYLQKRGETPYAYTFKSKYTPEEARNYIQKT